MYHISPFLPTVLTGRFPLLCQPSSPAGFRSSEEEPACGNRTAGEDSIWRQGLAAGPPTASLRPAARPPFEARPKWSSALKAWAFQKCPVPPRGTSGTGTTFLRKGCPGREEGPSNGSSDASRPAHGGKGRAMNGYGREPRAGSTHHQPVTGRTGKQADRQAGRLSGMLPIGGSSSGSSPDGCLTSPCLRINHADRLPRRYAACHLCGQANMQTVIRVGRQTATMAGRPKECSDAAPQHSGCGNP
jgi:hypothetical protein